MKAVVYEVQFGQHTGKRISELTEASFESIKLRASAMGWRIVTWYVC